uniref:Secreted protein n=1 Tax=Salix viminalis TaxID=40686 RepID=A0A6N2LQ98_SALVM
MAPALTMVPLLMSFMERLRSAVTACSWVRGSVEDNSSTRSGIAPASAMQTLLSAFLFANKRSSPAADLCCSRLPLANLSNKNTRSKAWEDDGHNQNPRKSCDPTMN